MNHQEVSGGPTHFLRGLSNKWKFCIMPKGNQTLCIKPSVAVYLWAYLKEIPSSVKIVGISIYFFLQIADPYRYLSNFLFGN